MRRLTALLLATLLAVPSVALGQSRQPVRQGEAGDPAQPDAAKLDPSKLGVDLSRIKRELAEPETEESNDGAPRLRFTVQVLGVAPRIDFLAGFPVEGPVPYGSPTHKEVLEVLTPKEYRSGAFPIYGLAVLAAQKLWQYNKKQRCEAEIAEYRRLVMQGVPIAAPQCTQ